MPQAVCLRTAFLEEFAKGAVFEAGEGGVVLRAPVAEDVAVVSVEGDGGGAVFIGADENQATHTAGTVAAAGYIRPPNVGALRCLGGSVDFGEEQPAVPEVKGCILIGER